jgi:hypothetical protein
MNKISSTTLKVVAAGVFAFAMAFASTASAYTFTTTLRQGSRGAAVQELQKFLNAYSSETVVATSGAGSAGKETTSFGPATRKAVIAFQKKNGLAQVGQVGPATRALLNGTSTGTGTGTGTTVTGPVSVSLSATTPSEGYVLDGQATAGLLDLSFSGTGTVNSVTLSRSGVSNQNSLSNVYLFDGVNRLTDGFSFNSNGSLTMNNLNIAVNGTKVISVKADISSNASSTSSSIAVALTSFSAGTSVSTVNVMGKTMAFGVSGSAATATLSSNTVSSASVNAGTSSYSFWSAPLQVNTRAVQMHSAAFRMIGSAPADALSNIKLFVNGVDTGKTASVMMMNGANYAVFDFASMPLNIATGNNTIEVRANIEKGSSRTIQFSLQQAADLMIRDTQVGINISAFSSANNAGTITINTGSITGSVDSTFQAISNVTGGASNVAIAKYKVRAYGEDVKINTLSVLPVLASMTPAAAGLQNVTVYFNGSQVGTQTASWTSGAIALNLGSQMIVPAGTDSTVEVRADIRTTGGVNYTAGTVSANLVVGSSNAQGQNSLNTLSTPAITGNTLTVQTGLLALSANPGYSNQNQNPNTAGVKVGSFVLQNQSSSEGVRITNLAVGLTVGGGTSLSNFGALYTSENSSYKVQPQATNNFSVDFVVAPGSTKTVDIFANSSSDAGATATLQTTLTVSSIGTSSNVTATSAATAGQTIAFRTGTVATPTIVASSSTTAQLVAAANGGSADGSKAVFNVTSSNASSTISELTFTVTSGTATFVKVGSVSAPVVGGTAYLTGLNIAVPNGGSGINLEAFVSYPEVGTSGVSSNTTSVLTLTTIKYTSGSTTTTLGSLTVAAPTMTLVGSVPAYTIADSTETLVNGSVKIAEVTVTANAKGDIKLGQLPVTITSTGVTTVASAADNIVVKDTSGATIATKNATFAVTAGGSATGTICFDTATAACASGQATANGYLIPAGTSKTFRIYVTASNVAGAVNTTSLSARLGAASSATFYDVAGANATAIAATNLYNYPTDTSVISN